MSNKNNILADRLLLMLKVAGEYDVDIQAYQSMNWPEMILCECRINRTVLIVHEMTLNENIRTILRYEYLSHPNHKGQDLTFVTPQELLIYMITDGKRMQLSPDTASDVTNGKFVTKTPFGRRSVINHDALDAALFVGGFQPDRSYHRTTRWMRWHKRS